MTADQFPFAVAAVPYRAAWVPADGIEQVGAGVEFDAVRVKGLLGHEVACALDVATSHRVGPVVLEDAEGDDTAAYLYYLVARGEGIARKWAPGIRVFGFPDQLIRVPALWGNTFPLRWRCPPTRENEFVDAELLHRVLCKITTWSPHSSDG
ncbi:hypothetical protein ACFRCG_11570 [Embleya sp. NPDC056575]|uniref:hypothetical protein n=1 Tax=unclassified Embleya TaxID=2699296 RepID=UPI0036960E5B